LTEAADYLSERQKKWIHSLVGAFLHLVAHLTAIPALCAHVEAVLKKRDERLEEEQEQDGDHVAEADCTKYPAEALFSKIVIQEALASSGHDVSCLNKPFLTGNIGHSLVDGMSKSATELNKIDLEMDLPDASPLVRRVRSHSSFACIQL